MREAQKFEVPDVVMSGLAPMSRNNRSVFQCVHTFVTIFAQLLIRAYKWVYPITFSHSADSHRAGGLASCSSADSHRVDDVSDGSSQCDARGSDW